MIRTALSLASEPDNPKKAWLRLPGASEASLWASVAPGTEVVLVNGE